MPFKKIERKKIMMCLILGTLHNGLFADTIIVHLGDSIQVAINGSLNGDTIEIEAGTYYEWLIDPSGKAITIRGACP